MQVRRVHLDSPNEVSYELLDDEGRPIEIVSGFLRHLRARGDPPNTFSAYTLRSAALHHVPQAAAAQLPGLHPRARLEFS